MDRKGTTRRRFLALTGVTLGACAFSCAGLAALALREDNPAFALPVGYPDLTLGESGLQRRILVTYASAAGSTGGVAGLIGQTLAETPARQPPAAVDVRPVQSVTGLDAYSAVVLGSAIHGGKWLPEAVEFVQANQDRLNQLPTAFFLVGLMPNRQDEGSTDLIDQFLAAERALVKPVAEGRFTGALFTRQYAGFAGFGLRFFIAYCGLGLRGGDFRDPSAIRTWAESVRPSLLN